MPYLRMCRLSLLLTLCVLGVSSQGDAAGIRIDRVRTVEVPDPNYRHYFQLVVDTGSIVDGSLTNGDFITIYDIEGLFLGTNLQPDNWAASFQNEGIDPLGVDPPFFDDPNIPNVTWRFFAPIDNLAGFQVLGTFSVQAFTDFPQGIFNYGSRTTTPGGQKEVHFGTFVVPEPTSWALMLVGITAVGSWTWRSRHALGRTA